MLRRVVLVRTDVPEERSASIIKVTRIGELGATLAVSSSVLQLLVIVNVAPSSPILVTLMMEAVRSFETSLLTRATRRNIPYDGILQKENCSSFSKLLRFAEAHTCACLHRWNPSEQGQE
jgi:cobalamin synthase